MSFTSTRRARIASLSAMLSRHPSEEVEHYLLPCYRPILRYAACSVLQERAMDNGENDYYKRRSRYHAEVAVVICIVAVVLIAAWVILA